MKNARSERLFSYGTLQQEAVQLANSGRKLEGIPDAVMGYRLSSVQITDPEVVAENGLEVHKILVPGDDPKETVQAWCSPSRRQNCAPPMPAKRMPISARVKPQSGPEVWVHVGAKHG